jgi:serine/threonine protein kinase/Tol biopolymer transport system component
MTLSPGVGVGPYEVVALLGAGGMGEVYEARDTRLDRTVALKVLLQRWTDDPSLQARFEREARAIAKLSHPHVCALFDVGRADVPGEGAASGTSVSYLVMERLKGETLDARLARGPLPMEQVLALGRQIASALAAAHREGIVHRDLKPSNVMLTPDGVKLLDFGLAHTMKRVEALVETRAPTSPATQLTTPGSVLGTFPYMAPEQLEGKEVDARSDIFAFGAVLYEMATGRRAFDGASQASLIAAVMASRPEPIARTAPHVPPAFEHLVSTCLAKNPEERWQSARDLAMQLQWMAEQTSADPAASPSPRGRGRELAAWATAATLALVLAGLMALGWTRSSTNDAALVRFTIPSPDGTAFESFPAAVSPDGRRVAFVASDEAGASRVWVRPLDGLDARPLPGTEGAFAPFWSPNGRAIAFLVGGELRRVDLDGTVRSLCATPGRLAGTWGSGGVILLGFGTRELISCPETGGLATRVAVLPGHDSDETIGFWPHFLPDGDHFLISAWHGDSGGIYLASLSSPARRLLLPARSHRDLSRTAVDERGFLVFSRDEALFAQRFDLTRLELQGAPVRIADRVEVSGPGSANFSISRNGVLVYREDLTRRLVQLTWIDPTGTRGQLGAPGVWYDVQVSPDGGWVAVAGAATGEMTSVWLLDVERGTMERLSSGPFARMPVWSPRGDRLAYAAGGGDTPPNPVALSIAGRGVPTPLGRFPFEVYPASWSPDERHLLVQALPREGMEWEIWRLPLEGDGQPETLAGPGRFAQVSPGGRWVAYTSEESGRSEVYVASVAEPGRGRVASTSGGVHPQWSADARRLYYLAPDSTVMSVRVGAASALTLEAPEPLFAAPAAAPFAVTPDGQRFLFPVPTGERVSPPLRVVVNWPAVIAR